MDSKTAYAEFLKSPAWQSRRKARLALDHWKCQQCGSKVNLDVHHLNYDRPWGREVMADLVTLCRSCHYGTPHPHREQRMGNTGSFSSEGREIRTWRNLWAIIDAAFAVDFPNAKNATQKLIRAGRTVEYGHEKGRSFTDDAGLEFLISGSRDPERAARFRSRLASQGFPQFAEIRPIASTALAPTGKSFNYDGGDGFSFTFDGQSAEGHLIDGGWWFDRSEVCAILDLRNPSQVTSDFRENLRTVEVATDRGGSRRLVLISEAGLYRLIAQSRKPQAEAFRDWLFGEVLPEIRKTGGYGRAPVTDLSTISRRDLALMVIAAEDERDAALAQVTVKDEQLAIAAPLAEFAETFLSHKGLAQMRDVSQLLLRDPRIAGIKVGFTPFGPNALSELMHGWELLQWNQYWDPKENRQKRRSIPRVNALRGKNDTKYAIGDKPILGRTVKKDRTGRDRDHWGISMYGFWWIYRRICDQFLLGQPDNYLISDRDSLFFNEEEVMSPDGS